jgi:WhiB family redox-sensing transcriptional regulator
VLDPEWRDKAACKGINPNLFVPPQGAQLMIQAAKKVCAGCPVTEECLDEALSRTAEQVHGVWGGTTQKQRIKMKKQRPPLPGRNRYTALTRAGNPGNWGHS